MATHTIQVRKKGNFTFPVDLRNKYHIIEGNVYTLIDLEDGFFLLTPRMSQVNRLGDRVAEIIEGEGVSLDDLMKSLDDEREIYYREHYAGD